MLQTSQEGPYDDDGCGLKTGLTQQYFSPKARLSLKYFKWQFYKTLNLLKLNN